MIKNTFPVNWIQLVNHDHISDEEKVALWQIYVNTPQGKRQIMAERGGNES